MVHFDPSFAGQFFFLSIVSQENETNFNLLLTMHLTVNAKSAGSLVRFAAPPSVRPYDSL